MVMGLGSLGMFAVQFLARSGANPLIAVNLNPERRGLALKLGADYALDPAQDDFVEQGEEDYERQGRECLRGGYGCFQGYVAGT